MRAASFTSAPGLGSALQLLLCLHLLRRCRRRLLDSQSGSAYRSVSTSVSSAVSTRLQVLRFCSAVGCSRWSRSVSCLLTLLCVALSFVACVQDVDTLPQAAAAALQCALDPVAGVSLATSSTLAVHMSSATAALAGWAPAFLVSLASSDSPRCWPAQDDVGGAVACVCSAAIARCLAAAVLHCHS